MGKTKTTGDRGSRAQGERSRESGGPTQGRASAGLPREPSGDRTGAPRQCCEHGVPYPILHLELPNTGWRRIEVQAGELVWWNRCVGCGGDIWESEVEGMPATQRFVQLLGWFGNPALCAWCMVDASTEAPERPYPRSRSGSPSPP